MVSLFLCESIIKCLELELLGISRFIRSQFKPPSHVIDLSFHLVVQGCVFQKSLDASLNRLLWPGE